MDNQFMRSLIILFAISLFISCNSTKELEGIAAPSSNLQVACEDLGEGWSVPKNQVVGGGVGKDGIPAIENPQFIPASTVSNLLDEEIVIGVSINGKYKAFPHRILQKHEVVNSRVEEVFYTLTYCPLTGTSVTWPYDDDNTHGVSGLLHNSNLITYDRKTDSNWAQIYSKGINGEGICASLDYSTTIEVSWATWKARFPDSEILSTETGFNFNYTEPAGSLTQPENVIPLFPVYNEDDRLPNYERVLLVVIDGRSKAYRLSLFEDGTSLRSDFLSGKIITLMGDKDGNFIVPYLNSLGGTRIFSVEDEHLVDNNGNIYDLFGEVISGPDTGENLEIPYSMMGYWFAVSAFFPDVEIFQDGGG